MKFEPHNYQQHCIELALTHPRYAFWQEPGLGKTSTLLTVINELRYSRFEVRKVLVIAPKKVAEATWQREAAKWDHLHLLRIATVMGSTHQRIRALHTPADIYVINRDNVCWLVDYYRNDWPFDMMVLDESSSFKNHQAKRFKALKLVAAKTPRIYELTGTPAPNTLLDLWAQIYLLDAGERLGRTIGAYRERYFTPGRRNRVTVFDYDPKDDAEEAIHNRLVDIAISMKERDYLDLPDLIYETVPVMLDAKAQRAYKQLERDMLLEVPEGTIVAQTAAVLNNKLLQLGNGAIYDENREVAQLHDCKLDAFMELIEQLHGQSALVYYAFQHDRDRLLTALARTGLRVRVYRDTQDEKAWNAGEIDVLLAHPASVAYGLNLQDGGHHVIWFGLTWSLELYQQANKRLHRQGQQHPVVLHHLVVQGSVDEDVMAALDAKTNTQEALMQALKARIARVKGEQR